MNLNIIKVLVGGFNKYKKENQITKCDIVLIQSNE